MIQPISTKNPKPIVFIADRAMLPGLHVALLSAMQHLRDEPNTYEFVVLADGWRGDDSELLRETAGRSPKKFPLSIVPFTPTLPEGANALHGNATTYGRLFLPSLLPQHDNCVYLDSDIVVQADVGEIFDRIEPAKTILAYVSNPRKNSLEKELFKLAGLDMDGGYFNAGILGMNLKRWRDIAVDKLIRETLDSYPGMFKSADQAVLNCALHSEYAEMPVKFNLRLFPPGPPYETIEEKQSVLHFVGSPKPWDFGGRFLHPSYQVWRDYYSSTAISRIPPRRFQKLTRTLRISKSLLSLLIHRLRTRLS